MEWYNSPPRKMSSLMGAGPIDMNAQGVGRLTAPYFFNAGDDGVVNGSSFAKHERPSFDPATRPLLQSPLHGDDGVLNGSRFVKHGRASFEPSEGPLLQFPLRGSEGVAHGSGSVTQGLSGFEPAATHSLRMLPAVEMGNAFGGARPRPGVGSSSVTAPVHRPPEISDGKRRRSQEFPQSRRVRPTQWRKLNAELSDDGAVFASREDGILGERPGSLMRRELALHEEYAGSPLSSEHCMIAGWPSPYQPGGPGMALDGDGPPNVMPLPRWLPPRDQGMTVCPVTEKGLLGKGPALERTGLDRSSSAVQLPRRRGRVVHAEERNFAAFGRALSVENGILGEGPVQQPMEEPRIFLPSSQCSDQGLLGRWTPEAIMPALGVPNDARFLESGPPEHAVRVPNGRRGLYREQSPPLVGVEAASALLRKLAALQASSNGGRVDREGEGPELAYHTHGNGRDVDRARYEDAGSGGYEPAPLAYENDRRLMDRELQYRDLHAGVDPGLELAFRGPGNGLFIDPDPHHLGPTFAPHLTYLDRFEDNLIDESPHRSSNPPLRSFLPDFRRSADLEQQEVVGEMRGQGLLGRVPSFARANVL